jgi:hypothetical protein
MENKEELKKEIEETLNDKTLCYEDTIQKVEVLKAQLKGIEQTEQKFIDAIKDFEKDTRRLLMDNSKCKCTQVTDKYANILDLKVRELLKYLEDGK